MMVSLAVSLSGAAVPPRVLLVVDGLSVGMQIEVLAAVGTTTWRVRGSARIADSPQQLFVDDLTPVNVPIRYSLLVDGALAASSDQVVVPLTVRRGVELLLSSEDGSALVAPLRRPDTDPGAMRVEHSVTWVPGRPTPVIRFTPAGGRSGTWELITTTPSQSEALRALLAPGAPLLARVVRDRPELPAVAHALITSVDQHLLPGSTARAWQLSYVVVADPLADVLASVTTWSDVDAAYPGVTFADLDGAWQVATFGQWNTWERSPGA